jgi:MipA family protein
MKNHSTQTCLHVILLATCCLITQGSRAASFDVPGALPSMVGGGLGSTTDYAGAKDRFVGAVPGIRYVTDGGKLFELYGPYAQFDLGGLTGLQYGPAVELRLGRSHVDDPVVSQVHDVHTTVEAGGFVGYEYDNQGAFPYRLRGSVTVVTNAGIVYTGARVSVNGSFWLPVQQRIFVGTGVGASWVSQGFNQVYYGVTAEDSTRSGLPAFSPSGGLEQMTGWLAAIYQIDKHWFGGAMIYYQRISGSAADSPIVTQRGNRNQITYGVGVAYAFK